MNIKNIIAPVREADFSEAFLEIQLSIHRLAQMARLAEVQADNAVGALAEGRSLERPEMEATQLVIFAIEQTSIMASDLCELHDRLRIEGAERAGIKVRA
jgi:hypothetical protein